MSRRWARKIERYCCIGVTYFPLAFVYGLTTWAVWVIVNISSTKSRVTWIGPSTGVGGVLLYALLNWSYTTAVFTSPGSTTNDNGYSTLPTHAPPQATSFTVKSNGELRFCKKCQARKPDRAHHCSSCRRCVLKMDHHCPWLATCIGLRNHKAFLLFLVYTTIFSLYAFAVSGSWVWAEIMSNTTYVESLMPINFIMLSVISGIIGIVVGAFTAWHIYLATKGQTTIECLEKTRYLSPLRKSMRETYVAQHNGEGVALPKYGQQLLDIHQNALPGITRPEEGEEYRSPSSTSTSSTNNSATTTPPRSGPMLEGSRPISYDELERYRAAKRYEEYLDEQDSSKLPNAFDLGTKRNLLHLFGPNPWLWAFPICNTTGDGWSWEPSPKWIEARDRIARERSEQRARERAAGWGDADGTPVHTPTVPVTQHGAGRHYLQPMEPRQEPLINGAGRRSPALANGRRTPSKADRVLGRDPNMYADASGPTQQDVNLRRLSPAGRNLDAMSGYGEDDLFDTSSDEEEAEGKRMMPPPPPKADEISSRAEAEQRALNLVTNGGWGRSGASGLLRKVSSQSSVSQQAGRGSRSLAEDDGVD
ncbi:Palmitoyltransferase PFA3 [Coniochaeta sp. 2T2.1]|nr:Palmitoyltransferase PFA3 [Coniochaeta sp. 2T2.1]